MKQKSVESRLAALYAEIERRRMIQEEPLDPLSQSLMEYFLELASLDEAGKAAYLEKSNQDGMMPLTPEALDKMVEDAKKEVASPIYRKLV